MNEKRRRANAIMMKYYSGMIDDGSWKTAAGDIAVFNTKYRRNLKSLVVQLEPIQSGTGDPSPDNVRPISGRTGATVYRTGENIFDEEFELGGISSIDGSEYSSNNSLRTKNYIQVIPGKKYYFLCSVNVTRCFYDENKQWISTGYSGNIEITAPSNAHYFRFSLPQSYGTTYNHDIAVNYPSTARVYEPYAGATIPISWETEAGTVYGGELDVISGVLKNTYIAIPLEEFSWGLFSSGVFNYTFTGGIPVGWTRGNNSWGICSTYKLESWDSIDVGTFTDYSIHGLIYNNSLILRVYDSRFIDAETFKAALTGQLLVFKSTTETEYQLTPQQIQTLIGENIIWSDAGPVSVEYWS